MKTATRLDLKSAALVTLLVVAIAATPRNPQASPGSQWKNCSIVNQRYPHGVGRANAVDHTSGTPVTNFTRSTSLYNTAMRHHSGLDRDNDGIACERA
jgi:Excalibur calcium-binding domain